MIFLFLLPLALFPPNISPYLPWARGSLPHSGWPQSYAMPYEELEDILLSTPDEFMLKGWSHYYTAGPHLAGKNFSQALWTKERFQQYGIADTSIVTYDVFVNYPKGHRLALLEKAGNKSDESLPKRADKASESGWDIKFEASLEEEVLKEDHTSGLPDRIPTFHGYSASGNVTASYVFANYGTYRDFEDLVKANISVKGKIVITKYGKIFRGLKVKRAQDLGAIGVVIYSDPGDDSENVHDTAVDTYPKGPGRNPSSVQRGSVQFLSKHNITSYS
jgi:N-acetylated-alpha-linked acidic dipeptidase